MNAYISITEQNTTNIWAPSSNEQYSQPPQSAICWVKGESDDELLEAAKNKIQELGFTVINTEFYRPGPGEKSIHVIVEARTDTTQIPVGDKYLYRSDTTQWVAH